MFDMRLRFPFSWLVTGGSGSGKTTMVLNFLRSHKLLTTNPLCENVIYCYNEWQTGFDVLVQEEIVTEWIKGLPTISELKDKIEPHRDTGSILVIDDFGQHLNATYVELFTVLSHHANCSVILLTQNLFDKNPIFRQISLNSTYISIFKNPRDSQQIAAFARQIKPTNHKFVVDSFIEATKVPYSYLFFDNHQETPDALRIRSRILPGQAPMTVWTVKK